MVLEECAKGKSRVYKEYNMSNQGTSRDIQSIKNWLIKQPHLPLLRDELFSIDVDEWLENYLICCKNSVERVKECLDMYFTSKIILPEVFTKRDPLQPGILRSFDVMGLSVLPKVTPSGSRVFVFSHLVQSADNFDPVFMLKRVSMMLDIMLVEGIDYVGLEVIVDMKNVCFSHLTRYNPALTKKVHDVGLKALPQRLRKIHIVNPSAIVETGLAFFKPILSKKLQERWVIHRDLTDLHSHIPACVLPSDLGGEEGSIVDLNRAWQEKLNSYREWFQSSDSVKTDESKRIGKCRYESTEMAFGNQGSFRKIEVD